jgi:hypothetical protein
MPNTPVRDINGIGTRRLKTSGANGPADRFSSQSLINAAGVISQVDNNGVQKFVIRGDGRRNGGILAATPGTLIPGDYYIVTILGIDYLAFVDTGGTQQLINLGLYQLLSQKGVANGYAGLDASAMVLEVNLPATVQAPLSAFVLVPAATTTTVDSLPVASATTCQWIVELTDGLGFYGSLPVLASKESPTVIGFTVGTATSVAAGFIEFSATVDISAGNIRLRVVATGVAPGGWSARAVRRQIV